MSHKNQEIYEFGPFILQVESCVLTRHESPIHLTPKAFDVLVTLVRKRNDIVSKAELLNTVWPGVHVDKANVEQQISELRAVLADAGSADRHVYIKTVWKRGYRFVAPVKEYPTDDAQQSAPILPENVCGPSPQSDAVTAIDPPKPAVMEYRFSFIVVFAALAAVGIIALDLNRKRTVELPHTSPSRSGNHHFTRLPIPRLFAGVTSENATIQAISLPEPFHQMVLSPDSKRAYLAVHGTRKLAMLDIPTLKIHLWEAPFETRSIAVSPDNTRLFVGSFVDGLAEIDAHTGRVLSTIPTGGAISDIAISRDGRNIYVAMMQRGVHRYSLDRHEWKRLTTLGCPYYCSTDEQGTKLIVGYQCGGPTGKNGHDAIEVFDLATERSLRIFSGPPLVGSKHMFFPDGDQLWLDGGDACSRDIYDRQGCPTELSLIHHIFRLSDGQLLRSIPFPLPGGIRPILFGNGDRVLKGYDNRLTILETARFAPLESFRHPFAQVVSDAVIGDQGAKLLLILPNRKELQIITADSNGCDDLGAGAVHRFSGDGTEHDSIDNGYVRQLPPSSYAPGFVGQAFKFTGNERAIIHSSSDFRPGSTSSTIALYVKPSDVIDATLLERGDSSEYLRLTCGKTGVEFRFKTKSDPALVVRTNRDLPPNKWSHIAVTQTSKNLNLFLNGALVGQGNSANNLELNADFKDYPLGWSPTTGGLYRGLVDELVLWSRVLSPEEILALYQRWQEPPCKVIR